MENPNPTCPVCTLYLREGISLQAHLETHPKDQVIDALLKISYGGTSVQISQETSTSTSFLPAPTFGNSNTSFISQAAPYVSPPTQMTTAVTYQHFMTSNGTTIMPQYIQVPAVVNGNSIPVIANQPSNLVPNQTVNYSHTMYNPLYNPYIPQPYPFTQPVFTGFPVTLPPMELNTQTNNQNLTTTSQVTSNEEETVIQSDVLINKCNVSTNTEPEKKSKRGRKKKLNLKSVASKKTRIIVKQQEENSNSSSSSKTVKTLAEISKLSVIKSLQPKITSVASLVVNENSQIISPPPLTLKTETTSRAMTGSTPPPPPLAKAPCFAPPVVNFIKSEDVTDCARSQPSPILNEMILNNSSNNINNNKNKNNNNLEYMGRKINTVIVESCNTMQNNNSELEDCNENEETCEYSTSFAEHSVRKDNRRESLNQNHSSISTKDKREMNYESEHEECIEEEEEEEYEKQEKIFQIFEVEEEVKGDFLSGDVNQEIPNENCSESIDRNCDGSEIFVHQENSFTEKLPKHRNIEIISGTGKRKIVVSDESIPDNTDRNHSLSNCSYYEKDVNQSSHEVNIQQNQNAGKKSTPKNIEIQRMTYTDLQPAKNSRVFQNLGLSPLNFNNYMEVDGIKIFFNNNAPPLDPLVKLTTNIQPSGPNPPTFMKTESNHTIVDSVIQLVSKNNESKNDFTFGGNSYPATTSQVNESNMEHHDLSPLPLNIQADESMPARGELSEQESLGAENSTWNLFRRDSESSAKSLEYWRADNTQSVSVIGSKKNTKSFKCSICSEVFTCPKERRVHKNTVHLDKSNKTEKSSNTTKKQKSYECSYCFEVFTSLGDRKTHVVQKHYPETKNKRNNNQIKKETAEPEAIVVEETSTAVKNESQPESNVKTENSLPNADTDPHQVRYCSRCSLPFVGVKKLREHLRVVHGEVRFKCESCSANFDEENEYNEHLLVHPLVCDKCGKTFHRKPNLTLHMKRHLEVKPYECSLCPKSFVTRQKLEEHMNGHSGKKPIKCTLCDKTFSRHSNLIQHRNLHHLKVKKKIKDFVCRCGEVFHSLRKLEWHKEVHEPKPKPCPFCSQKFIHSASVTRHIRRAHLPDYLPGDNREFDNVQCPVCEKVYLRSSLMVHMRVHNGEKPFVCKICNKGFSTKWNLELHSWTHQSRSNMPFKCHICKSAFFREPDFVAHLNSHRNYKPYTCNICGQKFIRKYSCLRHQEEHKKKKQFVCAVSGCAKSFHRSYYLRDHMKVHTGLRPHTCHICGKASSTKSNHNKHVRIHDTRELVNTEN